MPVLKRNVLSGDDSLAIVTVAVSSCKDKGLTDDCVLSVVIMPWMLQMRFVLSKG